MLAGITFQIDDNCKSLINDNGLRQTMSWHAHTLADLIAWSTNRGIIPRGVVSLDLRDEQTGDQEILWNRRHTHMSP